MKFTLVPTPPFNFDLSAKIFSEGDKQIQKYENGKYWQVIRINNNLVLIILTASGTIDAPRLHAELKSSEEISGNDEIAVKKAISNILNLNLSLDSFYEDVKNDRIMAGITEKLRGLRNPTTATVFEALISSIIEQQISLKVAHILEKKLIKTFGDALKIDDEAYYAFPTPQKLVSATVEQLRTCGLSKRKSEYIRDSSKLITEGKLELEELKNLKDNQKIIERLCRNRGIGVWTAELTMIRGMQKLDTIPGDDLGLKRTISHYYRNDRKISSEETRKIAKKWGKWAGLAGFYLIVAERSGI
jgi:DNA-3-methyladenine glycosylase II